MISILLIGVGGILGACCRYYLGFWLSRRKKLMFPWGTWTINVTGSFLLGVVASYTHSGQIYELLWKGCGIGFLGAYTTFSTFGYETIGLIENGEKKSAAIYVCSSVIVSILFAAIGLRVGQYM